MEVFLIKAIQLILSLAFFVLMHEGGHFLFAKLFKVRVEKFCLFFDPWKSWKLFSFRGTDYHIGWLPLGGYVKISGMIDESMDTEAMKQPEQPWEFRAKPAWQRLLIMIGGVLVNFLLALFIYGMILFTWGEQYVPIEKMSHGFEFNESAKNLGFRDGDILLGTNEGTLKRFNGDAIRDLSIATSATVLREGKEITLPLPGDLNLLEMTGQQPVFIAPMLPSVVDSVPMGSSAYQAGLRNNDRIIGINGISMDSWSDFDLIMHEQLALINHYKEENNNAKVDSLRQITLFVQHSDATTIDTLYAKMGEDNLLGFYKRNLAAEYPMATRQYALLEALPAGIEHGWNVLTGYVSDLKYVFTAEGAQSVGSFGTLGSLFPNEWNWLRFWELTALFSLILAVMNILPIPALDGGHVLFLLYEVVTRRKPSDKFMEYAQSIGMWLLFGLMLFAIFNDVVRFIF